ncbi:MAG: hypothetical protein AAB296_10935, partial [Candidatus Desantisbacteria bacterium]
GQIYVLSPTSGFIGDIITVQGRGYGSVTFVWIDFGTYQTITSAITDADGLFIASFAVNQQPMGSTVITAWGPSIYECSTTVFFILTKIVPYPTNAHVGDVVNLVGTGFGYSEGSITIRFEDSQLDPQTATANQNGTFSITFTIGAQPIAARVITADRDATGYADKDVTALLFIVPDIAQVIPVRGLIGDTVTIIGTGYDGTETVFIHFGTTQTITSKVTNSKGTFSVTFIVTTQASGRVVITGVGGTSEGVATNTFSLHGIWFVSPATGIVGNIVSVVGAGYQANEVVHISFSTQVTITTVIADSVSGDFVATFIVDTQVQGTKVVTATGTTPPYLMDTEIFILIPHIVLVPNTGYLGNAVTVYGTGYPYAGNYNAYVFLDDNQQTTEPTDVFISEKGTWTASFNIPSNWTGGRRNVKAEVYDGSTPVSMGADTQVFTILPEIISVAPSAGPVGQIVAISGKAFSENETIRISFGTQQTITTTTADPGCPNGGIFSVTFIIGTYSSGGKVITVTGFTNNLIDTSI